VSDLIAIVGRPNVGKSALFNRIVGRRIAIVHDEPGVTRDRISAEAEWHGRAFTLMDTGGIGLLRREKADDAIVKATVEQVTWRSNPRPHHSRGERAGRRGRWIAKWPSDCGAAASRPVAVNKVDTSKAEPQATEFVQLGFQKIFPGTAIHGEGMDDLMTAAIRLLPEVSSPLSTASTSDGVGDQGTADHGPGIPDSPLKLAIVGRPNVGKSSIINTLTNSERVIVSPVPGTTRDSIDVPFEVETDGVRQKYVLIDTAGMRKTRRVNDSVEFFSVQRAEDSIARCDIAVLVLDAESGILEQDKKIADRIVENKKACIVVVNKWDLYEETVRQARTEEITRRQKKEGRPDGSGQMTTLAEFGALVQEKLFFLDYAGDFYVSRSVFTWNACWKPCATWPRNCSRKFRRPYSTAPCRTRLSGDNP
jgi:GTP-binding protein